MTDPAATFAQLRKILLASATNVDRATDKYDHLHLNTKHIQANKKPLFFGAVQIKKKAVAYHLMPLYTHPDLLRKISPALKKHMQGKSCFHFSATEPGLLKDLEALTRAGADEYRKSGYL